MSPHLWHSAEERIHVTQIILSSKSICFDSFSHHNHFFTVLNGCQTCSLKLWWSGRKHPLRDEQKWFMNAWKYFNFLRTPLIYQNTIIHYEIKCISLKHFFATCKQVQTDAHPLTIIKMEMSPSLMISHLLTVRRTQHKSRLSLTDGRARWLVPPSA